MEIDYSDLLAAMSAKKEIQIKHAGHWYGVSHGGLCAQMARGEAIEWRERVKTMVQRHQTIPAPMAGTICIGDVYFVPNLFSCELVSAVFWTEDRIDRISFERGLVYATAEAAAARAQAMLNISEE